MNCHCGNKIEEFRITELNSKICSKCAHKINTPIKRGIMIWNHKTAPELQVVSEEGYKDFAANTNRKGQKSVLRRHSPKG